MAETTTIQLDEDTKALLDNIKKESGSKSYAAAIAWLAKHAKILEKSEKGMFPKLRSFKREKHDRFD
jgi:hypothetical protein